jgi:predicted component of type VI protein secretion system
MKSLRFLASCTLAAVLATSIFTGCSSSGSSSSAPGTPPGPLSLSLSTSTVVAPQDGTPGTVAVTVSGADTTTSVSVAASNLPTGVTSQFAPSSGGSGGTLSLIATATAPAGTYSANVVATNGTRTASQSLVLVVAIAAAVGSKADTTLGVGGKLDEFMSTSFQPAEWDFKFFQNHAATEPALLSKLGPQHIRLQPLSQAVPMRANTGAATDWDFSVLDAIVQPILNVADNSPEFQIAVAPPFLNDPTTGHFVFTTANAQAFAQYSANLVRYYNAGGFTWGPSQTKFVSPNPQRKITWWGIFNEYNINGMTPSEYIQLYNTVVPAMLAVDSTIKISAMELAVTDPTIDLPPFVAFPTSGGVNAQVNVVSTHFYPTCNQQDLDTALFGRVPQLVQYIAYVYQQLSMRADLKSVPVWFTENNVNADFPNANGTSNCNPAKTFVLDPRGTSAFFAAWRPYVFSQFGKAGNQALYHWDYDADAQFGEVDFNTDTTYLSYWVDYWLGQMFPVTQGSPGPDILQLTVTETSSAEILATKNADGSVAIMIADRAIHAATDNNGTGDPRTAIIDVSALGPFSSAMSLTIDAKTSATTGPVPTNVTPTQKISVTLGGYGVTFLKLKP